MTDRLSPADLRSLAQQLAPIVLTEIAKLLSGVASQTYSTRQGRAPEGYSRDAWRDLARRIGVKRGRYWVVTATELEAYERGNRATPPPSTQSEPWHPRMAAEAMGLRPTRS